MGQVNSNPTRTSHDSSLDRITTLAFLGKQCGALGDAIVLRSATAFLFAFYAEVRLKLARIRRRHDT